MSAQLPNMLVTPKISRVTLALRGVLGRCPKCGKGRLFKRYLKSVDACSDCGETYGHIRAEDGPAWLTILVAGHMVLPATAALAMHTEISDHALIGLCSLMIVGLTLILLPRMKGLFIVCIWQTGCIGSEKPDV